MRASTSPKVTQSDLHAYLAHLHLELAALLICQPSRRCKRLQRCVAKQLRRPR